MFRCWDPKENAERLDSFFKRNLGYVPKYKLTDDGSIKISISRKSEEGNKLKDKMERLLPLMR